jgi:hypothetical protein
MQHSFALTYITITKAAENSIRGSLNNLALIVATHYVE